MNTWWHTTDQPINRGTLITEPQAVATALRLARTGWHTCIDGRLPSGHVYAGPVQFQYEEFRNGSNSLIDRLVADIYWGGVEPVLCVSPASSATLAQDIEFLRRDGQAHLAHLVADLRKRLFGD